MVWNKGEKIIHPTSAWKSIDLLQYDVQPFRNEDLFGEGHSVHERAKLIKKFIPLPATKSHSVNDWKGVIKHAFQKGSAIYDETEGEQLRKMAIRFAVTDPSLLFEKDLWKENKLVSRHDTIMWRAVYDIFGAPWTAGVYKDKKRSAIEVDETTMNEDNEENERENKALEEESNELTASSETKGKEPGKEAEEDTAEARESEANNNEEGNEESKEPETIEIPTKLFCLNPCFKK